MAKVPSKSKDRRRKVTFSLDARDAREVILMGDFNQWNPKKHPMRSDGNGMWTKSVMLYPGSYEYKFLVDRNWKEDPRNDQKCANCFGTCNNVLRLAAV